MKKWISCSWAHMTSKNLQPAVKCVERYLIINKFNLSVCTFPPTWCSHQSEASGAQNSDETTWKIYELLQCWTQCVCLSHSLSPFPCVGQSSFLCVCVGGGVSLCVSKCISLSLCMSPCLRVFFSFCVFLGFVSLSVRGWVGGCVCLYYYVSGCVSLCVPLHVLICMYKLNYRNGEIKDVNKMLKVKYHLLLWDVRYWLFSLSAVFSSIQR